LKNSREEPCGIVTPPAVHAASPEMVMAVLAISVLREQREFGPQAELSNTRAIKGPLERYVWYVVRIPDEAHTLVFRILLIPSPNSSVRLRFVQGIPELGRNVKFTVSGAEPAVGAAMSVSTLLFGVCCIGPL
jgi:hypothetical protein